MKSVLISIQPYWVFLIIARAMGWDIPKEKMVEVRKNYPKSPDWNKISHIYCSRDMRSFRRIPKQYQPLMKPLLGKVVGEFYSNSFDVFEPTGKGVVIKRFRSFYETCLSLDEINKYANGMRVYGWRIANLVIYDKPKELSEFIAPSKFGCCNEGKCKDCIYFDRENGFNVEDDCNAPFCTDDYKPLRRPPQSWCYVGCKSSPAYFKKGKIMNYKEQLEQAQANKEKITKELDRLSDERIEIENRIENLYDEEKKNDEWIVDINRRIATEGYDEREYYLLCVADISSESRQDMYGYFEQNGKYIVTDGKVIVSLNEPPKVLARNEGHRIISSDLSHYFNVQPDEIISERDISVFADVTERLNKQYYKLPYNVVAVGNSYINKTYLQALWSILRVDEKAEVYTYIYEKEKKGKKPSPAVYSLCIKTSHGIGIILGHRYVPEEATK